MKKQPVGDVDEQGNFQRSWLWTCEECAERVIHASGKVPPGWEVTDDGEEDLDTCDAICPECVGEGYGGSEEESDEEPPGLEIEGDHD